MATKKFNTFEYAAMATADQPENGGVHCQDAFETPLGHAFVIVASNEVREESSGLCAIALQRVRYYMEQEPEERKADVPRNALIYTSGYIFQNHNKDASSKEIGLSCLCVLYSEEEVYYSWTGDVGLCFFTGKRMHWLNWQQEPKKLLLGQQAIIEPESNGDSPLRPVNGDKLLLMSGHVSKWIHTKATKRILKDSMPLQTKVTRILRHPDSGDDKSSAALIILRFHAVSSKERVVATDTRTKHPEHDSKTEEMANKKNKKRKYRPASVLKVVLWAAGLLAVTYFVYDLFIYDPHPPVSISVSTPDASPEEAIYVPEEAIEEVAEAAAFPDDVEYTVRSGDTWGRIYSQFAVCSWFIINHPPNTGRFGSQGSLIAGQRLQIPLRYSGNQQLNPHYYTEFTAEKVGSGCQNVDRSFLESFASRVRQ